MNFFNKRTFLGPTEADLHYVKKGKNVDVQAIPSLSHWAQPCAVSQFLVEIFKGVRAQQRNWNSFCQTWLGRG